MRSPGNGIVLCCLGVVLLFALHTSSVEAKVFILSPDRMLEEADVIFTGHIVKFEKVPKPEKDTGLTLTRYIHVKVDQLLKGELDSNVAVLEEWDVQGFDAQRYPESKKEKLLVLQRRRPNQTLSSVADSQNIGIIRNGRVIEVIYENEMKRYTKAYDAYYQANKSFATTPPQTSASSRAPVIGYIAAATALGIGFIAFGILRQKRKRGAPIE